MANEVFFKMSFSGDQLTQAKWREIFPPNIVYQDLLDSLNKEFSNIENSIERLRGFGSSDFVIEGASAWSEPDDLFTFIMQYLVKYVDGPIYALMEYREQYDNTFGISCIFREDDGLKFLDDSANSSDYQSALEKAPPKIDKDDFINFIVSKMMNEQKRALLKVNPALSALINPNLVAEMYLRCSDYFTSTDKGYHLYLLMEGDGYVVIAYYGKHKGRLSKTVKTKEPVSLVEAEKVFHSLILSKVKKGYSCYNLL